MKNLFKFFLFVALLSLAISALYDYRLKHGGLRTAQRTPEKYTLANSPTVDPKQVAIAGSLEPRASRAGQRGGAFCRGGEDNEEDCG